MAAILTVDCKKPIRMRDSCGRRQVQESYKRQPATTSFKPRAGLQSEGMAERHGGTRETAQTPATMESQELVWARGIREGSGVFKAQTLGPTG